MTPALHRWSAALGAAAAGMLLTVLLFHPGWMSVDSAYQYAQVLGIQPLDDVHPPLFVLLWRAIEALWPGPGALFLLLAASWWLALAAVAAQLLRRPAAAAATVLLVGAWPPALLMLGHLWKDVAMAVALLLATAAILAWRAHGRPWAWACALLALAAAVAFRHNGLFAALPLLGWLLWPRARGAGSAFAASTAAVTASRRGPRARTVAGFLACAALLAATPELVRRTAGATAVHPWTAVLLWDLAPLSLAAGRLYYPPQLTAPDLEPGDLRAAYVPWSNVPLFATGKIRLSFFVPYSAADREALCAAWWRAVREQPGAYLAHRWALARHLLLGFDRGLPRELVFAPVRILPHGSPRVLPPVDPGALAPRLAERLRATPLFAGGGYLVLAVVAVVVARRRGRLGGTLALALSAFGTALPLLLISGSAEFRYLLWTVLAALLAMAHALAGRESGSGGSR